MIQKLAIHPSPSGTSRCSKAPDFDMTLFAIDRLIWIDMKKEESFS
jgi:hypothetical protein